MELPAKFTPSDEELKTLSGIIKQAADYCVEHHISLVSYSGGGYPVLTAIKSGFDVVDDRDEGISPDELPVVSTNLIDVQIDLDYDYIVPHED